MKCKDCKHYNIEPMYVYHCNLIAEAHRYDLLYSDKYIIEDKTRALDNCPLQEVEDETKTP